MKSVFIRVHANSLSKVFVTMDGLGLDTFINPASPTWTRLEYQFLIIPIQSIDFPLCRANPQGLGICFTFLLEPSRSEPLPALELFFPCVI